MTIGSDVSQRVYDLTITPILDSNSLPLGRLFLLHDITNRKNKEKELQESEEKFRQLAETTEAGMFVYNGERFVIVNPAFQKITGYSREELEDLNPWKVIHPLFRDMVRERATSRLKGEIAPQRYEVKLLTHNGDERWADLSVGVFTYDGKPASLGTLLDITERRKLEEELRISQSLYLDIVEDQTDPVCRWLSDTTLTFVNQAYCDYFGQKREVLLGKQFKSWLPPETQEIIQATIDNLFRREVETISTEEVNTSPDGCKRWMVWVYHPIKDKDGNIIEFQSVGRDITERKQSEAKIQNMNQILEERVKLRTVQLELANEELTSISYSMAHSLKTPLRALDGFSYILLEEYNHNLDENGKEYLNRIRKASQQMWQVTDGLMNLLTITRGELKLSQINLCEIAHETIQELRIVQPDRRVEFICPDRLILEADAGMIRLLMDNLLGNAWKFTRERQPGRIELGSKVQDGQTVYFICDNGIGFDMAYYPKLFGVFQRLHASDTFEGSGVGLAISQRIIQRHGGRIWAEGLVDQGATFYFTFHQTEKTAQKFVREAHFVK